MKKIFFPFLLLAIGTVMTYAQPYYVTGSAVPDGKVIPLEKWDDNSYKFHGTLLPGSLYIINTSEVTSSTRYLAPRQANSNIVCNRIGGIWKSSQEGSEWAVLFEADNYRFTINSTREVSGEIFTWWYEAWIVGGCTEDNQGTSDNPGSWQLSSGKQMIQSPTDPYEWSWVGELKAYAANDEPKRFKIIGQYGWGPKHLHPYTQDASILKAKKVIYNNSNDYKWVIESDGYYRIKINVFLETISGEYLGVNPPSSIGETYESVASVTANGRTISVKSCEQVVVQLFSLSGQVLTTAQGTDLRLEAPTSGVYLVRVDGQFSHFTRKVAIE